VIELLIALAAAIAGLFGMGAWNSRLRKETKAKDEEILRQAGRIVQEQKKIEAIRNIGKDITDKSKRDRVRDEYTRENRAVRDDKADDV
jgi:hypothetical protein